MEHKPVTHDVAQEAVAHVEPLPGAATGDVHALVPVVPVRICPLALLLITGFLPLAATKACGQRNAGFTLLGTCPLGLLLLLLAGILPLARRQSLRLTIMALAANAQHTEHWLLQAMEHPDWLASLPHRLPRLLASAATPVNCGHLPSGPPPSAHKSVLLRAAQKFKQRVS